MSCYINVYIKDKKTKRFTRLFSMSRSSAFYEAVDDKYNLWEKCLPFSKLDLVSIENNIKSRIEDNKDYIKREEERIKFIAETNCSLKEKLEARTDSLDTIEEVKEDLVGLEFALSLTETLVMIANNDYTAPDDTIYMGVENADPNGEEDE